MATGRAPRILDEEAMAALQTYDWPGNVRQLRNIVERILILSDDSDSKIIGKDALPPEVSPDALDLSRNENEIAIMSVPLREAREAFEREYLKVQITRFSGNISRTATFVGMERSALHRKLKSLGLTGGAGSTRE